MSDKTLLGFVLARNRRSDRVTDEAANGRRTPEPSEVKKDAEITAENDLIFKNLYKGCSGHRCRVTECIW
jgi:hypothetical protein